MTSSPNDEAPPEKLEVLFDKLCDAFADRLDHGEDHVSKDGAVIKVTASAATLKAVAEFLKQNGIDGLPKRGSPLGNLVSRIPKFDT